jgi:hypothetical protein
LQVRFTDCQVLLDGRPGLLLGGEFQYFRINAELWRPSLEKLKAAGLNTLSAYVPWIWHEYEEGKFDFTGHTDPSRDLARLLALCEELEFPLIIKPGPYIFAEYQGFGVPYWLRDNHPDLLMQVKKPQAYPQPSLNHPQYLRFVRRWFEQVAEIIRPYVERGSVIAIQVDNETGYPQFGQGPHMTDLNPETLGLLRAALAERFSSIDELNHMWGTSFASFAEVVPPEERLYNGAQVSTMTRYVEDYIVVYLRNLKRMWEEIGLDTFYFLNDIWLDSWPSHLGKKNTVAPLAFDIYPRYSDLPITFDQPFSISYVPKLFDAFLKGGPLMAAEMGCGWLDPASDVSPAATWQSTMAAYAHGTKACYFYTAMDGRDPDGDYIFKPLLDIDGNELPRMDAARRLADFCREWGADLADSVELNSRIAILHYPAITREMMAAALAPIETIIKGSHRAVDEAMTIVSVNSGLYGALSEAGYNPIVLNLDLATVDELCSNDVIFFNSIGVVDAASQQKLNQFVRRGGKLVTLGMPFSEDSSLFPARITQVLNPQSTGVMLKLAWDYVKLYWRMARQFTHRFCAYTVEGMYPAMLMTRYATRTGLWLHDKTREGRLWASRLVTLTKPADSVRPLLSYGGRVAGYEAAVDQGHSVFIGTLLGASFDSPGFYLDEAERKRSVSDFIGHLLQNWAVMPEVSPIDDVETVVREGDRTRLVFLINRGPSKSFTLSVNRPWQGYEMARQYSAFGSHARWEGHRLVGTIEKDDVLSVMWELRA